MDEDLQIGSEGPAVEQLHDFLRQTGYLPNLDIAQENPEWKPIVATNPSSLSIFDESTELAVKAMQRQGGLMPTGVVDAETQDLMAHRACGAPEDAAAMTNSAPGTPVEKYAYAFNRRSKTSLTWKISNPTLCPESLRVSGSCSDYVQQQISAALAQWAGASALTFTFTSSTTTATDITFTWASVCASPPPGGSFPSGCVTNAGFAGQVRDQSVVLLNSAWPSWTRDGFLQTLAAHESGHSLGLHHSTVPACTPGATGRCSGAPSTPLMVSTVGRGGLTEDDRNAIQVYYPKWETVPGCALDIGSVSGSTWVIGCDAQPGGHSIHRWNGSNWDRIPGAADRVAVSPNGGAAWVVNSSGQIFVSSFQNGSFSFNQFPGCARDIALTPSGWPAIIGCDSVPGGFGIYGLGCSGGTCNWFNLSGGATNIAIGKGDQIWVTNSSNDIFRRRTDGGWDQLPGRALDVTVSLSGSPWAIGTDNALWSFAEQTAAVGTGNDAPGSFQWNQAPGRTGLRVAVDEDYVWVAGSTILRLKTR